MYDPCLLVFTSLCNPFPLNVSGACDLLLTKGIWQRWWDVTPTMTSGHTRLCLASKFTVQSPLGPDKVSIQAGKVHMTGNCSQPLGADSSQKNLGPSGSQLQGCEFCQQPKEVWKQILPQLSLQMRIQLSQHSHCSFVRP